MLLTNDYDPMDDLTSLFEAYRCARNYAMGCTCAQEIRMYLKRHGYIMVDLLAPDWYDETKFYIRVPCDYGTTHVPDDEVEVYGNIGYKYKRMIIRHGYHYDGQGLFDTRDGYPMRLIDGPRAKFDSYALFEIPESDYLRLIELAKISEQWRKQKR